MIAKRISTKAIGGYQSLAAYVLNVKTDLRAASSTSWSRLQAYVLDENNEGEKVAWHRVTNCHSDDPGWAVKEILGVQARNTRAHGSNLYHLVVSFPEGEGEQLTRKQMEQIEDRLVASIGLGEHQRVSAVHQNTENWHLHVAANLIHPQTLRKATIWRDHYRLQSACIEIEREFGLEATPHTEKWQAKDRADRAQAFEARDGGQSFTAWAQFNAAAGLLAVRDSGKGWQGLHEAAAAHGLVLKLRGAGLVIGHANDARLHVKASSVDRGLSLKTLSAKLGTFEPAGQSTGEQPARQYRKPGRSGSLFDAYGQERAAAELARKAALDALREQHKAHAVEVDQFYRERMTRERARRGPLQRDSIRHVVQQREKEYAARKERQTAERSEIRTAHPVMGWQPWLEAKAAAGDLDALGTLRSRQKRATRLEADLLASTDPAAVKHVLKQLLRPQVRGDGTVIYRAPDGGIVADEAREIRVPKATDAALAVALSLARERFNEKPIAVQGSDVFRERIAEMAGEKGVRVTFRDARLEAMRQSASRRRESERGRGLER